MLEVILYSFVFSVAVCAARPWMTMGLGLVVIAILCYGVVFLKITTDPVDLWASPESRSRLEREYYDENFQPFYRTEHIILRAVGLPNVIHNTSKGVLEFGPVFNKNFLMDVHELKNQILKVYSLYCCADVPVLF